MEPARKLKWTYEKCLEYIQENNILCRKHLDNLNRSAYHAARTEGFLDKLFPEFKKPEYVVKWTKSACFDVASKCLTLKEFRANYVTAYVKSSKRGWLPEIKELYFNNNKDK